MAVSKASRPRRPTDRALALNQLQELLEDSDRDRVAEPNARWSVRSDAPGAGAHAERDVPVLTGAITRAHVSFGLDEFIGFLPAKSCTLQDYGINHARRVLPLNRLTELRAAGAGGEGATRPCLIRFDPHNPLFVWIGAR